MKKLLIPAMGVAAAFGAAQPAAADVLLSQLMIQGQPGYTGTVNRTLPSGSSGIAPLNTPVGPSPYGVAPAPSYAQPSPFIGQRGELNYTEREVVAPGEPDSSGKIGPTTDRARARFAGERGSDGKLLPTYGTQAAQATTPSQTTPQASPPTPAPSDVPATQPSTRRPGSGAASTPAQTGATGTTTGQPSSTMQRHAQTQSGKSKSGSMQSRSGSTGSKSQQEANETAALNALSAEGYVVTGKLERVGNTWQVPAMKDGRQTTVQIDPQTHRVTPR